MAARHPTSSVSTSIAIARPTSSISLRSTTSNPFSPALTCLNVTRFETEDVALEVGSLLTQSRLGSAIGLGRRGLFSARCDWQLASSNSATPFIRTRTLCAGGLDGALTARFGLGLISGNRSRRQYSQLPIRSSRSRVCAVMICRRGMRVMREDGSSRLPVHNVETVCG